MLSKSTPERFFNADKFPGFLEYATCYVLAQLSSWYAATKQVILLFFRVVFLLLFILKTNNVNT